MHHRHDDWHHEHPGARRPYPPVYGTTGEYRHYGGYGDNLDTGPYGYRGRGPKGFRRTDERIREDVAEMLTESPELDASELELAVSDRCVILRGTVHNRKGKRLAEDLAERVWGVEDVRNELRIAGEENRAA